MPATGADRSGRTRVLDPITSLSLASEIRTPLTVTAGPSWKTVVPAPAMAMPEAAGSAGRPMVYFSAPTVRNKSANAEVRDQLCSGRPCFRSDHQVYVAAQGDMPGREIEGTYLAVKRHAQG